MLDLIAVILLAASLTFLSSIVIILTAYLQIHKKHKRNNPWDTSSAIQPVTSSAPISRRTSTSCLVNLEKPIQLSRSRSASFSEDLSARLQILASGNTYRAYSQTITCPPPRSTRSSLSANTRFSNASITPPSPQISTNPSISFEIRYENSIETLFINIYQLQNYSPIKNSQTIFLILYLLPNDDEQRQTRSSNTGVFNELFQFPIKSTELSNRTLRITAYTVDSATRIRQTLGHVFAKLDQILDENQMSKTLSECLIQDPQIRSDYLGELILTNTYFKDQNLLQIRIQQINQLHVNLSQTGTGHFSGQTSNICQKNHWINTSIFAIPISSSSFRIDQELNLPARSLISSTYDDHLDCHLRLHIHGINEIHSHARWQYSLRSNSPQTITVPLVAF